MIYRYHGAGIRQGRGLDSAYPWLVPALDYPKYSHLLLDVRHTIVPSLTKYDGQRVTPRF